MQDISLLQQLWQTHCDPEHRPSVDDAALWTRQVQALYARNIAHPLALQFLLHARPRWPEFLAWLEHSSASYQILDDDIDRALPDDAEELRLSKEQIQSWQEFGYLRLPGVISAEHCAESRAAVWEFLGAQPSAPESWYSAQARQQGLMLALYNQPRLNTNRASRRIRAAYQQLYAASGIPAATIYKTIDHLSFNPPENAHFTFRGDGLHWDVSLALPIPERYQGLLYLTDCAENDGAFHCVPEFHHLLETWLGKLRPDEDARQRAAQELAPQAIPGKAGDFIIWHQALPHCASPNRGKAPRIVQYLSYLPSGGVNQQRWL